MEEIKKILIIDDSQYDRKAIKIYLESGNEIYNVVEAVTKEQGTSLLSTEDPDLVILDYLLPDGDGFEFLSEVSTDIPIIMLTGQLEEDMKSAAKEKGVETFLTKENHDMEVLRRCVKDLLRKDEMYSEDTFTLS